MNQGVSVSVLTYVKKDTRKIHYGSEDVVPVAHESTCAEESSVQ